MARAPDAMDPVEPEATRPPVGATDRATRRPPMTAGWNAVRRLGPRRATVLADQAVSSLSNVVMAVLAARHLDPAAFGALSVAIVAYQLVLGGVQAVGSHAWLSRFADSDASERDAAASDLTRAAAVAATFAAGACVIAALLVDQSRGPLLVTAAFLPVLCAQDATRFVAVLTRPLVALTSDVLWLVVVVAGLPLLPDDAGPAAFVAVWGVGGALAFLLAACLLRVSPWVGSARSWWSAHGDMAGRFLGEFASARAAGHVVLLALGAIAGLQALGAVRAAQVFYGPLNTLFAGIYLAVVPDGVRVRHDAARLTRLMILASVVVTAAAAAWMVIGVALPDAIGEQLFGATWAEADDLMFLTGLATIAGSAALGGYLGIRSLGNARASLQAQLWSLPPQAALSLAGAFAAGAAGYTAGFAAGNVVAALIWWRSFRRALERETLTSAPDEDLFGAPLGYGR